MSEITTTFFRVWELDFLNIFRKAQREKGSSLCLTLVQFCSYFFCFFLKLLTLRQQMFCSHHTMLLTKLYLLRPNSLPNKRVDVTITKSSARVPYLGFYLRLPGCRKEENILLQYMHIKRPAPTLQES